MSLRERLIELAHVIDRKVSWHRLPLPLSLPLLALMRDRLREDNLYDTGQPSGLKPPETNGSSEPSYLTSRTWDGTFNDLDDPVMGATGSRFGRNVPLEHTFPEQEPRFSTPSVRKVSRDLMTRDELIPATTLNILAAAWIQFEVHDWFSHGPNDLKEPYDVSLDDGDDWPENPMVIRRTPRDATCDPSGAQTWCTGDTHWWDSSQIYGRDAEFGAKARTGEGGKLRIEADGTLPEDLEEDLDYADVPGTMWHGLYALHVLFTMEHNAIADRIRAEYPTWSDQQLYDKARLANSALIAKIHTLDWTPAIVNSPTLRLAMKGNWWGLAGERLHKRFGRISKSEIISGIPGSPVDHHGTPYSLTEEFVAVYRMHPLIPDEFEFRSLDDKVLAELTFPELNALHARERVGELTMLNTLYSMGTSHPGAITLHNYPRFLQHFDRPGRLQDGSRRNRPPALARAGRPALREVPRALPHEAPDLVRADHAEQAMAGGDQGGLRRRPRRGRPPGGSPGGAGAEGLRLQRHGVSRLHPDGFPPPQERPFLHDRLPARGVHAGGARLGRGQRHAVGPAQALPAARAGAERREEPLCPVGQDRLGAAFKGENARRRGCRLGFVGRTRR